MGNLDLKIQIPSNDSVSDQQGVLPIHLESVETTMGTRPEGFRFHKAIVNITAKLDGQIIDACGEDNDLQIATAKAQSELVERAVFYKVARDCTTTNGWAAHPNAECAKRNAIYELAERDAVLAHWYSTTPFEMLAPNDFPETIRDWISRELSKSEFPHLKILLSTLGLGPSASAVLVNEQGFGVVGHCAKQDLNSSIEGAIAEACRAAHLYVRRSCWVDTVALLRNDFFRRVSPSAHALYYAYREPYPTWMFGGHVGWEGANSNWSRQCNDLEKAGFEFHGIAEHPVAVGYAIHRDCFALSWGPTLLDGVRMSPAAVRLKNGFINVKPHIVS